MEYKVIRHSDELMHYGVPRRSGRYPWGSGERPYQSDGSPPKTSKDMKKIDKKLKDRINEMLVGRVSNKIDASPEAKRSGEVYKNVAYDKKTGFIKINHIESRQDRLKYCNPNYVDAEEYLSPYNGNCGNSVIANELRRRGLDVEARGNNIGMPYSSFCKAFQGLDNKAYNRKLTPKNIPKYDEEKMMLDILTGKHDFDWAENTMRKRGTAVENEFARQIEKEFPDGSRGAVEFIGDGFSHWLSFDIKNGKAIFSNPQNPDADLNLDIFAYYKEGSDSRAIRLDGLDTNNQVVKSYVKNRGDRIADLHGMDWDPFESLELNDPKVKKIIDDMFGKKWDGTWTAYDPETKTYKK